MDNAERSEFIERVRERSDIFSVVSRYVRLNLKGGRYWACCPFHGEKTASFTVTPDKGLFYCFGCHAGGNVFNFIAMIENVSYFEAVKLQAERLGIPIPMGRKSHKQLEQEREVKTLQKINGLARDFYQECLTNSAEGSAGRKYLNSRGITDTAIEKFQLGFAPNSWRGLTAEFIKRGFTSEQLISAGLAARRKDGSGIYDRMRGRIIIPITDIFGHVVGFGGRLLNSEAEKNSPKYLNTPETAIFNKRKILFGLDKAAGAISAANCAVVTEGYMDVISPASAGIENVVATLGTAFTEDHAKLLLRYARRIIFCYDSDEAGQRATVRALPIVRDAGADVSVITFPDGKDPDEFVRKHGKKSFERLMKNAVGLVDYRLRYVLKNTEHSTLGGKIDALRKIFPVVSSVKDSSLQAEYRKKISAALLLDENVVMEEWQKFDETLPPPEKKKLPERKKTRQKKFDGTIIRAGEVILRMAWYDGDILAYVFSLVPKEIFCKTHQEIIGYLEKCFDDEQLPDDVTAAAQLSKEANAEISRILSNGTGDPRETELEAFEDSVKAVRLIHLKNLYAKSLKEAEEYMTSGNPAYAEKMRETLKIKKEIDEL